MKKSILLILVLIVSCSTEKIVKESTPAEQVEGIQAMCKNSAQSIKARQEKKSLYERLGKREGINNFFKHLLPAHRANKKISHLFKNSDDKSVIAHSTDFLVAGSGGPNNYKGKSMKMVHAHMKITNSDFLEAGADVQKTMKSLGYGENEIQEVICALASFIPQVVVN